MNAPLLTIVTITKDDPRGLARTLGSAAALRLAQGVEHLVVYDGVTASESSDDSVIMLRQKSAGIAGAFNEGLKQAHGEWVWFLNGGDAVHEALNPVWLMGLLSATKAHVVAGTLHVDGESMPRCMPHLSYQWPLIACWLAHPATLVRRTSMLEVGGFETRWRIAMDYDLWWRLFRPGVVVDVISIPFARFDGGGISERQETRSLARQEEMAVVLTHSGSLAYTGIQVSLRIIRRVFNALFQWARLTIMLAITGRKNGR